jgi:hypothetical protein
MRLGRSIFNVGTGVNGKCFRGAESAGDRRVFWYNPATGGLEECVAKTLKLERASSHSGGWEGWKADGLREMSALLRVATVPGVVRLLRMVYEDNGAVHLIME